MTDRLTGSRRELARATRHGRMTLVAIAAAGALALGNLMAIAQETATPPAATSAQPAPSAPTGTAAPADQPVTTGTQSRAVAPEPFSDASQPAAPVSQQSDPAAAAGEAADDDGSVAPADDAAAAEERDANLPHDLSPWGMFMAADWVVKGVMIGLAFASLVTWTVWFAKSMEIAGAKMRLRTALRAVYEAASLDDAARRMEKRGGTGAALVRAAVEEVKLSERALDHVSADGLKERVASRLSRIQAQSGRRLMRGTGVLATIGSTAPFVGLFGTVWGIMNSFIGISEAQTTNLAVVAPGIAEALLATAIGLVAAIPAVMIYNVFARSITGYKQALGDAVAGIERLVSRDIDFRGLDLPAGGRDGIQLAQRQHGAASRPLAAAAE